MMRKVILVLICLLCSLGIEAQERRVLKSDLPKRAMNFLDEFYKQSQVSCWKEGRYIGIKYEVNLDNGTTLEFDRQGRLGSIDCGPGEFVLLEILPDELRDFITLEYSGRKVTEYSIDNRGTRYEKHEIEFLGGFEITIKGEYNNKY